MYNTIFSCDMFLYKLNSVKTFCLHFRKDDVLDWSLPSGCGQYCAQSITGGAGECYSKDWRED